MHPKDNAGAVHGSQNNPVRVILAKARIEKPAKVLWLRRNTLGGWRYRFCLR